MFHDFMLSDIVVWGEYLYSLGEEGEVSLPSTPGIVAWPQILEHVIQQAVALLHESCPLLGLCRLPQQPHVHLAKLHLPLTMAVMEYSGMLHVGY